MKTNPQRYHFAAPVPRQLGVDRTRGIITGVALITAGLEAKGHGIYIDDKTVTTALAALEEKQHAMKCSIRHLSWDDRFVKGGDRVEEFPGWFSGIKAIPATKTAPAQLVAAELAFYDTFKTGEDTAPLFARILELAEKTPHLFGVSLEPWGYVVYVGEDGIEYSERPKDIPLKYDGLPALRVTDLTYGALVDDPAANPRGLFAQLGARFGQSELLSTIRALLAGGDGKPDVVTPRAISDITSLATNPPASPMKDLITKIKTQFGANKSDFACAMTFVGENPDATIEAVTAHVSAAQLGSLRQQILDLTNARDGFKPDAEAHRASLVSLKAAGFEAKDGKSAVEVALAAHADLQARFDKLKNSGTEKQDLGAASTGADGEINPWLSEHKNLSEQARITKSDPARAAALKAAAKTANPSKK